VTHPLSSDGQAVVNRATKWIPIDASTPRGAKLQLISKPAGVAQYGQLMSDNKFFTHWFPMPTFDKDET